MKSNACSMFLALFSMVASGNVVSSETIRVALIETLSGPGAAPGNWHANHVQWAVDQVNKAAVSSAVGALRLSSLIANPVRRRDYSR